MTVSTTGFLIYNNAADQLSDNDRICSNYQLWPCDPDMILVTLGSIGKFMSNLSYIALWILTFVYFKAARNLDQPKTFISNQEQNELRIKRDKLHKIINIIVISAILVLDLIIAVSLEFGQHMLSQVICKEEG